MGNEIKVGDTVRLTRAKSINHFKAGELTTVGTVVKISDDHTHRIPLEIGEMAYWIAFNDRPGQWAFRHDEIAKVESNERPTKVSLWVALWEWMCPTCEERNTTPDYERLQPCTNCGFVAEGDPVLPWS
jgi:hypothetical protein